MATMSDSNLKIQDPVEETIVLTVFAGHDAYCDHVFIYKATQQCNEIYKDVIILPGSWIGTENDLYAFDDEPEQQNGDFFL